MILASSASTISLAQLAKMADGIVEVANPPAVASVAATSTSLDEVRQLTETLSRLVAALDSTEEDRKKFDTVMEKLNGFFQVRKNVIFERARFNRRDQREGESVEEYITCLYNLVDNCQYGDLKGEMIRDRLVVGIRDSSLSEHLQMDAALMLEKAKTAIRQQETVQEHQLILSNGDKVDQQSAINYVKEKPHRRHGGTPHQPPASRPHHQASTPNLCPLSKGTRCGKGPHQQQQCPAKDVACFNCKKKVTSVGNVSARAQEKPQKSLRAQ